MSEIHDLIRRCEDLRKGNAEVTEVEKLIKSLPAGYEYVLPREIVDWLWNTDTTVVPDALKEEKSGILIPNRPLHSMHVARKRANKLGISSIRDYIHKHVQGTYDTIYVRERWEFSYSDDFFVTVNASERHRTFYYNTEWEAIVSEVILEEPYTCLLPNYDSSTPKLLRYTLRKWCDGDWSEYESENKTLLRYACDLIEHFYISYTCGNTLDSLDYYKTKVEEWIPGTIFIPNELREAVEVMMDGGIRPCANNLFLHNYYRAASEHILRQLHSNVSKRVIEGKKSCVIM